MFVLLSTVTVTVIVKRLAILSRAPESTASSAWKTLA